MNVPVGMAGDVQKPESMPAAGPSQWHSVSSESLFAALGTAREGISSLEAARRLQTGGRNELRETKRVRPWRIFLRQFGGLLVGILFVAAIISAVFGDWLDAVAILAIIFLNALVGFYQELSAEKSIAALRRMAAPNARVRREGKLLLIPAAEVVRGDVLELESGDLVAADARLIEAASLRCVEAALTGESAPVLKAVCTLEAETALADQENMIFMGTSVAGGVGKGVVVATGMATEIGRVATLIETAAEEETPLQRKLERLGRMLVWASLAIVLMLFLIGWFRGLNLFSLFLTSVSLAVAAVPEGLPTVVTLALALGVMRMARRKALVRRLPAVETLGATTVICTDKTGTLTVGEMTVRELYVAEQKFEVSGEGYGPNGEILIEGKPIQSQHVAPLLELANILIGCNNAHIVLKDDRWEVIGDPTEGALLVAGRKAGARKDHLEEGAPRHREFPFDSDRKRRTVLRLMNEDQVRAFVNGAPDLLLERCTRIYQNGGVRDLLAEDRARVAETNNGMAARGLRVLGSAYRDFPSGQGPIMPDEAERDLVFVGLSGMYDPPRAEAREAVAECREAGIKVVMITGDHPKTALSVARELGIASAETEIVTGADLQRIADDQLKARVEQTRVFARVTAEHKLRIVRAWKANGAVVAMTGDGVNDAPALKGADIGIAMGRSGTEVTKQASDMIITDDNFASIVAAVEEGRGIYSNIRKALEYLLATNAGELAFMALALFVGYPLPLLPIHLLWINLVTDGLPALMLATSPLEKNLLHRPPRPTKQNLANRSFIRAVVFTGLVIALVSFGVYREALLTKGPEIGRTHAFAVVVFAQLFCAFAFLGEESAFWNIGRALRIRAGVVVLGTLGLQLLLLHSAFASRLFKTVVLSWQDLLWIIAIALIPWAILEITGALRRRFWRSAGPVQG